MTNKPKPGAYHSPLRARQKEQTGHLILEAVGRILAESDLSAVTIAEVARVAGVTERTVYRHFSTREELTRAFWMWQLERSGGQTVIEPQTVDALLENIRQLFASLDADEGVIRAVLASPESREVRKQANQRRLQHMLGFLTPLVPGLPPHQLHQMASSIISVCSVLSWMFMRDTCGYDGKEAGEAAALAVELIIEAGRQRAAALRGPTEPGTTSALPA